MIATMFMLLLCLCSCHSQSMMDVIPCVSCAIKSKVTPLIQTVVQSVYTTFYHSTRKNLRGNLISDISDPIATESISNPNLESEIRSLPEPEPSLLSVDELSSDLKDEEEVIEFDNILHKAAAVGDLQTCRLLLNDEVSCGSMIHAQDANGWHPIHEAVRGGHTDIVKLLIETDRKAAKSATKSGKKALCLSKEYLHPEHPLTKYLEEINIAHTNLDL